MANQVANKVSIAAYLTNDAVKNQINKVVGGKNGDRFISSLMSAVQTNQTLQKCTNNSLVNAALLGYTLNLSPSPQLGYFYMVPYNNHGTMEAQFQIGYRGLLQLAMRSGQYRKINAVPIKEGEFVSYNPLDESILLRLATTPCSSTPTDSARRCTGARDRWRLTRDATRRATVPVHGRQTSTRWPSRPCSASSSDTTES